MIDINTSLEKKYLIRNQLVADRIETKFKRFDKSLFK